eukprot:scaffold325627_cov72-Tisochrysis_lutea.AAC.6
MDVHTSFLYQHQLPRACDPSSVLEKGCEGDRGKGPGVRGRGKGGRGGEREGGAHLVCPVANVGRQQHIATSEPTQEEQQEER